MNRIKPKKKLKKKRKSTFTYDEKIAKGFCKVDYYKAHDKNIRMYEYIEKEKLRLSTPKTVLITDIIQKWKDLGENYESTAGKILLGIYEKNKNASISKTKIRNCKLLEVIAKPETLLLAYRAIKGNKGALTKGTILERDKIEKMTPE